MKPAWAARGARRGIGSTGHASAYADDGTDRAYTSLRRHQGQRIHQRQHQHLQRRRQRLHQQMFFSCAHGSARSPRPARGASASPRFVSVFGFTATGKNVLPDSKGLRHVYTSADTDVATIVEVSMVVR